MVLSDRTIRACFLRDLLTNSERRLTFLPKPYTAEKLLKTLAEILHNSGGE